MKTRPVALILLLAILGFMLAAATSCTTGAQIKLDRAHAKYESATGLTLTQTAGLLAGWWADYQAAKAAQNAPVLALPSK